MNRIESSVSGEKIIAAFIAGGDPNIETTEKLIQVMVGQGVDVIEIGIPFSDPIAEGPVTQEADRRAIEAGCNTDKLFDMVERIRGKINIPLLFKVYANTILVYGKEKFMLMCKQVGIDGIIIPDIPFEERDEFEDFCDKYGICYITILASASLERIKMLTEKAKGFLYFVPDFGADLKSIEKSVSIIKKSSNLPCFVEYPISSLNEKNEIFKISDGVIIGEKVVELTAEFGLETEKHLEKFIRDIK